MTKEDLYGRYPALTVCEKDMESALSLMIETYREGGKVLLCGNGGSAADSDHIAGELLKGFLKMRPVQNEGIEAGLRGGLQQGLPAIPLTGMSAALTASLNDLDPNLAYAQLTLALGKKGDLLIGLSTSGNAKNVCNAARVARACGMRVLALTGKNGGRLAELADVTVKAPETETYKVQECHLPIYHYLCAKTEDAFFDC